MGCPRIELPESDLRTIRHRLPAKPTLLNQLSPRLVIHPRIYLQCAAFPFFASVQNTDTSSLVPRWRGHQLFSYEEATFPSPIGHSVLSSIVSGFHVCYRKINDSSIS
ncbi:unnamed protein product [Periconia digitata]|uniref:Uncharacterized protein n=1 Tax=Periconia digitata TaxID=1303443 RepID=A0A9W4UQ98_9PLEO|nr:unnamed protein product [Periconia digitata]